MAHQRYTDPTARQRMANRCCPECGTAVEEHSGWGGPGCTLTDGGVAERIDQFEQDADEAAIRTVEGLLDGLRPQAGASEARAEVHVCDTCRDQPGSDTARAKGCFCPVLDNGRGHNTMRPVIDLRCPVHGGGEGRG